MNDRVEVALHPALGRFHILGEDRLGDPGVRPVDVLGGFLERGGREAVITNPENVERALAGETGTRIVAG